MYYVYLLHSELLDRFYIGMTSNLKRRVIEHKSGRSKFTSRSDDWKLVYFEGYVHKSLAVNRERKLKQRGQVLTYLKRRLGY